VGCKCEAAGAGVGLTVSVARGAGTVLLDCDCCAGRERFEVVYRVNSMGNECGGIPLPI